VFSRCAGGAVKQGFCRRDGLDGRHLNEHDSADVLSMFSRWNVNGLASLTPAMARRPHPAQVAEAATPGAWRALPGCAFHVLICMK
jgi:hypothetical protein